MTNTPEQRASKPSARPAHALAPLRLSGTVMISTYRLRDVLPSLVGALALGSLVCGASLVRFTSRVEERAGAVARSAAGTAQRFGDWLPWARPAASSRGVVLIIARDRSKQAAVSSAVQSLGYAALLADDENAVLERLRRDGDQIRLVLLDAPPGSRRGESLRRKISRLRPGTRVIGIDFSAVSAPHSETGLAAHIAQALP